MSNFFLGQRVTPLIENNWEVPLADGTRAKVTGPEKGDVYTVSGFDNRWKHPAIFLSGFESMEVGFDSRKFRVVTDEEIESVQVLIDQFFKGQKA